MEQEIFKDIPGYEGFFQVSNLSRVKGLPTKYKPERFLSTHISKGYLRLTLTKKGIQHKEGLHRLIALAFIPQPPSDKFLEVNHKDGNKQNNKINNLEWLTKEDHLKHTYGVLNHPCKPVSVRVTKDGISQDFKSIEEAKRQCGIEKGHMWRLLTGRKKTYKGYSVQKIL